jgi:hypothetical protein
MNFMRSLTEFLRRHGILVIAVVLLFGLTEPFFLGESVRYARQVAVDLDRSLIDPDAHLWEFGHLIWRPLGWVLLKSGIAPPASRTDWNAALSVLWAFTWVNLIAGLLTVVLWHSLALSMVSSRPIAFLVAIGFACANAFLTFSQSGSSYVPGLLFLTFAMWLTKRSVDRSRLGVRTGCFVGLSLATATAFWFPYILAAPATVILGLVWAAPSSGVRSCSKGRRLAFLITSGVVFVLSLSTVYALAMGASGLQSASDVQRWVMASSHGWDQDLKVARMATGLPRSFFHMGKDGIFWKRFLKKDPYAPVSIPFLIFHASLWKMIVFYGFLVTLPLALLRTRHGYQALLVCLAVGIPLVVFAVWIFEPGSRERYFPAYPFLVFAVCAALSTGGKSSKMIKGVTLLFLVSMMITNTYSMSSATLRAKYGPTVERIAGIKSRSGPLDLVAVVSHEDDMYTFTRTFPFHPINRQSGLNAVHVVEIATVRVLSWRQDFSVRVLQTWDNGGDVWITKRFLAKQPESHWNWTEGDDPRISWSDFPAFFEALEVAEEVGGADGFVRLERSSQNRSTFESLAREIEAPERK